ncbi:MAG: acetyl-CoA carboxylase carboxyltransferase subunit beta [Deltaproteobacteria bacterium]|nr:acetyl-CoA carboxylase carboxyltransferase subunit beta [Deltaproteobacteria bacterium]
MSWFQRGRPGIEEGEKRSVGEGVFHRCAACGETHLASVLSRELQVCPTCGRHERLSSERWLELLPDPGSFTPFDEHLGPEDPLRFSDGKPYPDRLRAAQRKAGAVEAFTAGTAAIEGAPVVLGVFLFGFLGGSMGSVVGEKITRVFERALSTRTPAVVLSASGGARMQEGIFSLMQMAKTVAARERLRDAGVPFVSVLLDPTTGGVAASYALLGDVNIAEPQALIGFAGPRVIEQTLRQKLPEGFQRSEFLLAHGMIDRIVPRKDLRPTLAKVLRLLVPR